jgi:hypothetical protein
MWDKFKVKNLLLLARVNHFAVTVFHLIPQRVFVLTGIYQQSLLLLDPIPLVKNKSNSAVMVLHLIQMGHVQMIGHRNQVPETILHYHLSQIKPLF